MLNYFFECYFNISMDYSDLNIVILEFMNRESETNITKLKTELNCIKINNNIEKFQRIAKLNGRSINIRIAYIIIKYMIFVLEFRYDGCCTNYSSLKNLAKIKIDISEKFSKIYEDLKINIDYDENIMDINLEKLIEVLIINEFITLCIFDDYIENDTEFTKYIFSNICNLLENNYLEKVIIKH